MEKIEFVKTEELETTGWYIVYYDEDQPEYNYDAIGPFDSEEDARATQEKYPNG